MFDNKRFDDLQWGNLKIIQSSDHFCFGTDSVLLSHFIECRDNDLIYDIGSGTGILTILLGGKNPTARVIGIEIQKDLYYMSMESKRINGLNNIDFLNMDIKDVDNSFEKASLIICNPPYEKVDSGIMPENDSSRIARYEVCADFEDIVKASKKLLLNKGKFYFIHKSDRIEEVFSVLVKHGFHTKKLRMIYSDISSDSRLFMACAQRDSKPGMKVLNPLIIHNENGEYTDELKEIYEPYIP